MYSDYGNRDPAAVNELSSILQQRAHTTRINNENEKLTEGDIAPETNHEVDTSKYARLSENGNSGYAGSTAIHSGPYRACVCIWCR